MYSINFNALIKSSLIAACAASIFCAGYASADPIEDANSYAVRIKSTVRYAFAEEEAGTSNGAGFLVDRAKGWILTNAHVAGYGTGDVQVSFKGHDYVTVRPTYVDPELDFAIVQIANTMFEIRPSAVLGPFSHDQRCVLLGFILLPSNHTVNVFPMYIPVKLLESLIPS